MSPITSTCLSHQDGCNHSPPAPDALSMVPANSVSIQQLMGPFRNKGKLLETLQWLPTVLGSSPTSEKALSSAVLPVSPQTNALLGRTPYNCSSYYCCVTNYHPNSGASTTTFLPPWILWVRDSATGRYSGSSLLPMPGASAGRLAGADSWPESRGVFPHTSGGGCLLSAGTYATPGLCMAARR